jgi:hypothetical protein
MRPVTEHSVFGVFAAAEIHCFRLGCLKSRRRKFAALVATIAKGLVFTFATGTPVIGLSRNNFDSIRRFLRNDGFHY